MKTKKIKSKKEKALIKLDIVFIFLCFIIVGLDVISSYFKTLFECFKISNGNLFVCLGMLLAVFCAIIMVLALKCWIPIAIYLAFRNSRMKVIKENNKYEVIDNIEYYRERFNNITPAEISLITDLEIEPKKDISASVLDLYQKGIIDFNENTIVVKNEEKVLKKSEEQLIRMIKSNDFSSGSIQSWKNHCINEAKENNYIKEKVDNRKRIDFSKNNKLLSICVKLVIISIILGIIFLFSTAGENYMMELEYWDTQMEETTFDLENTPEELVKFLAGSTPLLIIALIIFCSFFIFIGTIIYRNLRRKIHNEIELNNRYERTKESQILVKQIAGLKNYIHDFSLLSEKNKEHIMLWEDFLIYAVLLEENEIIIKDICKYKNINLNNFNNIKDLLV